MPLAIPTPIVGICTHTKLQALQLTNKKRAFVHSNLNSRTHSHVMSNQINTHFYTVRFFVYAHSEVYISKLMTLFCCLILARLRTSKSPWWNISKR